VGWWFFFKINNLETTLTFNGTHSYRRSLIVFVIVPNYQSDGVITNLKFNHFFFIAFCRDKAVVDDEEYDAQRKASSRSSVYEIHSTSSRNSHYQGSYR
jgi:hypothetical protein